MKYLNHELWGDPSSVRGVQLLLGFVVAWKAFSPYLVQYTLRRKKLERKNPTFTGIMRNDSPQAVSTPSAAFPPSCPLDTPARPERPAIW